MIETFLCYDHPEANGRLPLSGELQWEFVFKLEDGREIAVKGGSTSYQAFRKMFEQMDIDDTASGT